MTTFFLEYRNIFVFILCLFILTIVRLVAVYILSFRLKVDLEKSSAYESRFQPFSKTSYPFEIQFAVIAIMFLLFDIEVLYLFPLVSSLYSLLTLDIFIILGFYILLLIGLLYKISRKVLDFQTFVQVSSVSDNKSSTTLLSTSNLNRKNIQIKFFSIILIIVSLLPNNTVYAASFDANNASQETFVDLLNSMNVEELEEFNYEMQNNNYRYMLVQRVFLAVIINVSILFVVNYGTAIYEYTRDFISNVPSMISDAAHVLFDGTREMAIRSFTNGTAEERARMLETARQIIANRPAPVSPIA